MKGCGSILARLVTVSLLSTLTTFQPGVHSAHAAIFQCASGDVACLIEAINTANANGDANTIDLEAGTFILTEVSDPFGFSFGPVGLPLVTSVLTIRGAGADVTVIERQASAPDFRLLFVQFTGDLTLEHLTLRGGRVGGFGGGVFNNGGTLRVASAIV